MKINKTTNKVGIMQGRVLPDKLEKLQVFPRRWAEELFLIKKIGFDLVEVLDDKESFFRNLSKKELFSQIENSGLKCGSVCMDYLCNYSLLKDEGVFWGKIDEVINCLDKDLIFVIPFFDENKINSKEELENVFQKLSKHNFSKKILALEIDFPAEDLKEKLDKYDLKNIGICFDTGNRIGCGADLEKEIKILSYYIKHVHIKYKENGKNVRIREDSEQLKKCFKALKDINYKGLMVLETYITPIPKEEAKKNFATIQKYLNQ